MSNEMWTFSCDGYQSYNVTYHNPHYQSILEYFFPLSYMPQSQLTSTPPAIQK